MGNGAMAEGPSYRALSTTAVIRGLSYRSVAAPMRYFAPWSAARKDALATGGKTSPRS